MTASKLLRTDPVKRTEAAIRMRQEGWTLRKIAGYLRVTHTTVRRDLARWEQQSVERLLEHLGDSDPAIEHRDVP